MYVRTCTYTTHWWQGLVQEAVCLFSIEASPIVGLAFGDRPLLGLFDHIFYLNASRDQILTIMSL